MTSWKTPTPDQVSRAVALLGRAEQYRYFFDRLRNPRWLEPLWIQGFFRQPPAAIRNESRGTLAFPVWPESRYLARIATIEEAQPQVLGIVLAMPDVDNVRVEEDLADVMLALPASMAAQLVPKAKRWAESPYQILLPEKLGVVLGHLATEGKVDEALDLARTVLAVLPDPRPDLGTALPEEMRLPTEPTARVDVWHYEQVLKHVPELVDAGGVRVVTLMCDLLESAVVMSGRHEEEEVDDYSWIWRPAIEDHEQNRRESIRTLLVSAVRDGTERLAARSPTSVGELVDLLDARRWPVFRRLALHLLRCYPDSAIDVIEGKLTDDALFEDSRFRHEYVLLAAASLERVAEDVRATFLGRIERGPDIELFRERYREQRGADPSDQDVARYSDIWRRDHLAPLRDVLPLEWRRRYEELVAQTGEPDHPDFPAYSTGWVGPTSPKSTEDLRAMTVSETVEFLSRWTPPDEWTGPSREGLGRELTAIVHGEPDRFAAEARRFMGLHPTYVRAVVRGFADATKEGRRITWPPLLQLCEWVVEQPREIREERHRDDEDAGWGWTRMTIAALLSRGFSRGVTEMPFDLREQAWSVLQRLTEDPDPSVDYEARYGGTNMDPPTLSINTTRGEAMHAVVQYGLWIRRQIEQLPDSRERLESGFAAMPEVREVLQAHLDPARDPSLAIRAVYGQWFPWIALLDREWTLDWLARIFPTSAEGALLRDVAWETYVVFCRPYDNVFEILEGEYARAVERIGAVPRDRRQLADPDEHLAEHLGLLYGRGKLSLDSPTGTISRFYEKASDKLRAHATEFIGRSLRDEKRDIPSAVIERFIKLWQRRVERARVAPGGAVEEIANFGWWFVSGRFEEDWAVQQLEESLRLARKVEPNHLIAEKLAEVATRRALQAARCLRGLVEADREGWGVLGWGNHARTILSAAMTSDDRAAREVAAGLINDLGARGQFGFRDLLE